MILSTCQNGGGYFLPSGEKSEVVEFIGTLQSRAENTLCALDGARKLLEEFEKIEKQERNGDI